MHHLNPQTLPLSAIKLGNLRLALLGILQLSIREKLTFCEHLFQICQKTLEAFHLLQLEEQQGYPLPDVTYIS